jgi:uncharacterized membrane protein YphA (DoxX/SURF4 family)
MIGGQWSVVNGQWPGVRRTAGVGKQAYGLAILRILIGVFFFFTAISKLGWLISSEDLIGRFSEYLRDASSWNRWYLNQLVPGLPIFARVVVLGEFATALAFLTGFWTQLAAVLAFCLVLNYHVVTGTIFKYTFLTDPFGLPLFGGLMALALGGARLPWSINK